MSSSRRQFNGEPLLREVLADPIVLAVMAGDGTTRGEVEILIAAARSRLANARVMLGKRPRADAMAVGEEQTPGTEVALSS